MLTTVYPTSKILYAWVFDLVTLHPTFHRKTSTHEKFSSKVSFDKKTYMFYMQIKSVPALILKLSTVFLQI